MHPHRKLPFRLLCPQHRRRKRAVALSPAEVVDLCCESAGGAEVVDLSDDVTPAKAARAVCVDLRTSESEDLGGSQSQGSALALSVC